eukprot:4711477-Pyramimonas_sp.AAC.1
MQSHSASKRVRVGRAVGNQWAPTGGVLPRCALNVFFSVLTLPWHRRTGTIDDCRRRQIYVDDFT